MASSAPKKKRDFFNGSQGINLRDFKSPEPQVTQEEAVVPEGASVCNGRRDGGLYPPVGFPPSPDVGGHSSADSYPALFPNRQSSDSFYSQPVASGLGLQSKRLEFDDSAPPAEAAKLYASSSTPPEYPSWPAGDDDDARKRGKKRKQRCRMCANHGIYVEIKGHKWYCPYKNPDHNCDKCEITRKRQYFMAKQQELSRQLHHQEHLHLQRSPLDEAGMEPSAQACLASSLATRPSDFPRMRELLEETNNIESEDLFREINEELRSWHASHGNNHD